MDPTLQVALVEQIVPLAGLVVLVVLLVLNRKRLGGLLDRIRKVGVGGVVEIELATDDLRKARADAPVAERTATALERRFAASAQAARLTRVLWVDDDPANNRRERRYLRSAGMTVVNALSTQEGLDALARDDFDLVVTDMARPQSPTAGLDLARAVRGLPRPVPVIGYVGVERPTPPEFFGMTTRPDRLMDLVLDVIEQRS